MHVRPVVDLSENQWWQSSEDNEEWLLNQPILKRRRTALRPRNYDYNDRLFVNQHLDNYLPEHNLIQTSSSSMSFNEQPNLIHPPWRFTPDQTNFDFNLQKLLKPPKLLKRLNPFEKQEIPSFGLIKDKDLFSMDPNKMLRINPKFHGTPIKRIPRPRNIRLPVEQNYIRRIEQFANYAPGSIDLMAYQARQQILPYQLIQDAMDQIMNYLGRNFGQFQLLTFDLSLDIEYMQQRKTPDNDYYNQLTILWNESLVSLRNRNIQLTRETAYFNYIFATWHISKRPEHQSVIFEISIILKYVLRYGRMPSELEIEGEKAKNPKLFDQLLKEDKNKKPVGQQVKQIREIKQQEEKRPDEKQPDEKQPDEQSVPHSGPLPGPIPLDGNDEHIRGPIRQYNDRRGSVIISHISPTDEMLIDSPFGIDDGDFMSISDRASPINLASPIDQMSLEEKEGLIMSDSDNYQSYNISHVLSQQVDRLPPEERHHFKQLIEQDYLLSEMREHDIVDMKELEIQGMLDQGDITLEDIEQRYLELFVISEPLLDPIIPLLQHIMSNGQTHHAIQLISDFYEKDILQLQIDISLEQYLMAVENTIRRSFAEFTIDSSSPGFLKMYMRYLMQHVNEDLELRVHHISHSNLQNDQRYSQLADEINTNELLRNRGIGSLVNYLGNEVILGNMLLLDCDTLTRALQQRLTFNVNDIYVVQYKDSKGHHRPVHPTQAGNIPPEHLIYDQSKLKELNNRQNLRFNQWYTEQPTMHERDEPVVFINIEGSDVRELNRIHPMHSAESYIYRQLHGHYNYTQAYSPIASFKELEFHDFTFLELFTNIIFYLEHRRDHFIQDLVEQLQHPDKSITSKTDLHNIIAYWLELNVLLPNSAAILKSQHIFAANKTGFEALTELILCRVELYHHSTLHYKNILPIIDTEIKELDMDEDHPIRQNINSIYKDVLDYHDSLIEKTEQLSTMQREMLSSHNIFGDGYGDYIESFDLEKEYFNSNNFTFAEVSPNEQFLRYIALKSAEMHSKHLEKQDIMNEPILLEGQDSVPLPTIFPFLAIDLNYAKVMEFQNSLNLKELLLQQQRLKSLPYDLKLIHTRAKRWVRESRDNDKTFSSVQSLFSPHHREDVYKFAHGYIAKILFLQGLDGLNAENRSNVELLSRIAYKRFSHIFDEKRRKDILAVILRIYKGDKIISAFLTVLIALIFEHYLQIRNENHGGERETTGPASAMVNALFQFDIEGNPYKQVTKRKHQESEELLIRNILEIPRKITLNPNNSMDMMFAMHLIRLYNVTTNLAKSNIFVSLAVPTYYSANIFK